MKGGAYEYPIQYAIDSLDKKAVELLVNEYHKRGFFIDPATNVKIIKIVGNSPYPLPKNQGHRNTFLNRNFL